MWRRCVSAILAVSVLAGPAIPSFAQDSTSRPAAPDDAPPQPLSGTASLAGRPVEEVRVISRGRPLSTVTQSEILHRVRTREGEKFDPATVAEDYQRIFALRRFSNVIPLVQPTERGVIVVFEVTEQNQIKEIRYRGNESVDTVTLRNVVNLTPGEAVDSFRLGLAREAIQRVYQGRNYPYVNVTVDEDELSRNGIVVFNVTEGPRVRVRKVRILGNRSYSNSRIKDEIRTKAWFPFFVSGRLDPEQVERDVAAVRQFYENNGFFDARVGRKIIVGPDQEEVMVDFVIDEGPRYRVEKVSFRDVNGGKLTIPEAELRENLNLTEGAVYSNELVRRDVRELVKAYSPLGVIYLPQEIGGEEYLRIREERVFRREPGTVEIVYVINEGRPFLLGRVIVKGNERTQDKVVLREVRVEPGQLYNSYEIQRAQERIRATNLFSAVTITPIGEDPEYRDLLVEVQETQTARFLIGAAVTSNSGVLGNISYEQRNFDIGEWVRHPTDLFSNRVTGAGQTFRLQLEPGTELSRARVDFIEPWVFDQPYSLGVSGYLSQRLREDWTESRLGGRISVGKRFSDVWSARVSMRLEDVEIEEIEDEANRAAEVLLLEGHHFLDSVGIEVRRDTTDSPLLPSRGTVTTVGWEHFGLLGDWEFDKFTAGWNWYSTVYQDLLDRKTILSVRGDVGYITGDSPFFERFYGGGLGSVRGFRYRGISPRAGIEEDPIGGDFALTGTVELNFPIAGEVLRGVLFTDAGTVEEDLEIDTIRVSAGFGFRLTLPFFGQVPIALDFGFPLNEDDQDDTRLFSFSLGLAQ
jgi:outer membrane protein insertion porin family